MALIAGLKHAYRDWTRAPERGSPRLLALITQLARWLPRKLVTLLLYPIVAYFVTFSPRQVTASRQFLTRAWARPPRWSEVFAHYMSFARMVLDRVYWLSREEHEIPVRVHGAEAVESALADRRTGVIVVGSHLGSFEALRGAGERVCGRRIRPLMYVANARKVQQVLDAINPDLMRDVIFAGQPGTMLQIRSAIEQGHVVGILADRSPLSERTVVVPFMGQPAPFPVGAYRLAALLNAPVVFSCAVLDGSGGYDIHFEPMELAEPPPDSRAGRDAWIAAQAAQFARHLERYARAYPLNWFNFYDFWQGSAAPPPPAVDTAETA
jgi:predicted LPLAT superfamily acyltransferase